MDELKNCPFCGGEAKMETHVFHKAGSSFGVMCMSCKAQSLQFYDTPAEAARRWNERKGDFGDPENVVN